MPTFPVTSDVATFETLPAELKISIIEKLQTPLHWPENEAWSKPYHHIWHCFDLIRSEACRYATLKPSVELPYGVVLTVSRGYDLRNLANVSKELRALCTPFLQQELDIWDGRDFTDLHGDNTLLVDLDHVRSVRIHFGNENPKTALSWSKLVDAIVFILSRCPHITKLAIYYKSAEPLATSKVLNDQLVRTLEGGSVQNFGLYSNTFMQYVRYVPGWDTKELPDTFIQTLFSTPDRCRSLKRVEIVTNLIEHAEYSHIQRNLPSVESLTIVRARRNCYGSIDSSFGLQNWTLNPRLTRLHLAHCEPAHVQHILDIVRHFSLLEELLWDISGHYCDMVLPAPEAGWSQLPNALHRVRKPLRLLHLEHALEWELEVVGQIPAIEVVVAHYDERRIERVLERTRENFLEMKVLRVLPWEENWSKVELKGLCEARGVGLQRDAEIHYPCSCCYNPYA